LQTARLLPATGCERIEVTAADGLYGWLKNIPYDRTPRAARISLSNGLSSLLRAGSRLSLFSTALKDTIPLLAFRLRKAISAANS